MVKVVLVVTALLLPSLVGGAGIALARGVRAWRRRSLARARARTPHPTVPLERAATDVRRLRAQLDRLDEEPPGPGRAVRTRALRSAYGDALATACRLLEVPPPADPRHLATAEQYRVEAALRGKGLDVVRAATR